MKLIATAVVALLAQSTQGSRTPVVQPQGSLPALTAGAGVPPGCMVLGESRTPLSGYDFTGLTVLASTGAAPSWKVRAPMPTARFGLAAATVDGLVYAIGGTADTVTILSTVEAFDPRTNAWTTRAPMPTPRYGLATAVVNGRIYAIGGIDRFARLATVEEYNPETDTWESKAPMPTPRAHLAAAVVDGRIYAIGGETDSGWSATLEEYDPQTDAWNAKAPMLTSRSYLAAAATNGLVYAFGGSNGAPVKAVEAFDPVAGAWSTMASMPAGRYGIAGCAVNGKVYVMGGDGGSRDLFEFEPWVTRPPMIDGRYFLAATAVDEGAGRIYAIGGHNASSPLATNEEFDTGLRLLYVHRRD